ANLALMVDPGAEYAVARVVGEILLVAGARLAAVAERLGAEPERLRSLRRADLVGAPVPAPVRHRSRGVGGTPFPGLGDGTGIVHTAPGHGAEDFAVGQRNGLGAYCPVDEGGRFTSEVPEFAGRSVLDVDDDIIRWLEARGVLLHAWRITHSYPHCWRCRRP